MQPHSLIFRERFLHMEGAIYDDGKSAEQAMRALVDQGLGREQVEVVRPDDRAVMDKLEPESKRVRGTLIWSHLTLAVVGLVAGLVLAALLVGLGVPFAASSPVATTLVAAVFGIVGGLLWGGFFSLRPDHTPLVSTVEDEIRKGHFAVVSHTRNRTEHRRAQEVLEGTSGRVISSV